MGADRDRPRLPLPHDDDEAFPARDGGIDEVPGEHRVMLGRQRDDDGGIFRALGFVDRGRIGGNERVEFAERSAAATIAGIELMHMIRKGQLRAKGKLRPAQQFYALAG